MANIKNNTNELVTDGDATSEVDALTVKRPRIGGADASLLESSTRTSGYGASDSEDLDTTITELMSDLRARSEAIDRLQFDIEQSRARQSGLEAELEARQEITENLNRELAHVEAQLARKDKLLRQRNQTIKTLKAEIRQRHEHHDGALAKVADLEADIALLNRELTADRGDEAHHHVETIERQEGQIASRESEIQHLRAQLERTERYADSLRRQLRERAELAEQATRSHEHLESRLADAIRRIGELDSDLAAAGAVRVELEEQISRLHSEHAEEIRTIRFELGEAQETVAQHELIAEQLASDLTDTRGYRAELERMLTRTEETSQETIASLEKQNLALRTELDDQRKKLTAKSEAVNGLLTELAAQSRKLESIAEIDDVIPESDGLASERSHESPPPDRDRIARLLIGTVEGQELRFPLFKDRLTIGRADINDLQLKASYISRRHAVIVTDGAATRLIDWGSKNGVFVNGNRVTEHFLENGDTVTIGTADFRYEERPKREA